MRIQIGTKIMSGFTVILVFLAVLGIIVVLNVSNMNRQFEFVVKHDAMVIANAQELRKLVVDMETGQRGFVITQKDQFLEPYFRGHDKFKKLIAKEKELVSDNPSQVMALEKIEALVKRWNKQAAQPEIAMARKVAQADVDADYLQTVLSEGTGKRILDEIRLILDEMINAFRIDGNVKGEFLSEMIAKAMVDQETGQRGFLITGKEEFLEPYKAGQISLKKGIKDLRTLVANAHDRAATFDDLDKLKSLQEKWKSKAGEVEIELRRQVDSGKKTQKDLENILIQGIGKATLDTMREIMDRMDTRFMKAENELARTFILSIAKAMVDQETGQRGFLITGKEEFLEPYESGQALFNTNIRELRKLNSNAYDITDMKKNIDKVEKLTQDWSSKAAYPEIAARKVMNEHPESLKDVAALLITETGKKILDQIREEFAQFIEVEENLTAERQAKAAASFLTTRNVTITSMIISLVIGGLIAMFITRNITKPVHKLVDASTSVGKGDLTTEVKIKSGDEIGKLAVSFNQMVRNLKKSNYALQKSEERFRDLVENTTDWIWEVDEYTRYTYVSPQVRELLGYEPDEVIGMTPFDLMIEEDKKSVKELFVEITGQQESFSRLENCNLHKNGRTVILETSGIPIFDSDGSFKGYRGIDRDITERKKTEQALIQSEKLKSIGIITAGISHEFNNILNIISGNVQLLRIDYYDNSELMSALHTIKMAIDDGAAISRRMLEFTNISKDMTGFVPSDINDLLKQTIEFTMPRWKSMAQANGIDYKMDMDGMKNLSPILCNPIEIREVFINIINNALDAMPDGGSISFSMWSKEDTLFVSISDTGKGMTKEVKYHIFDPFFTTRCPEGTGLGMSTVYGIVKSHGGKIDVESEVGKGSTFTLQFPMTIKKIKTVKPERTSELKSNCKVLRILVVDDEEKIRLLLDKFLSKKGHIVKTVDNGADAIELAKREKFDLVLSDLAMPRIFGYDVIRSLNNLEKRPMIGIITGWNEELKPMDEEGMSVDLILRKPFDFTELMNKINKLINNV